VAYAGDLGAYCQLRTIPADRLVPLPEGITDRQAAAVMIKGLTAWYLLKRTHTVRSGETILIHAAAGGVGLIACAWANHLGATVIGTVGTDAKAELARAHGCHHPIVYTRDNFVTRVRELTGGRGLPVVYDSVGKDTFEGSLDCLSPLGMMVTFGQASGPVPPLNVLDLSSRGSLFLTRPTLFHYVEKREELLSAADELFRLILDGILKIEIGRTYPLHEAADAHRDLESRKTVGSTVLLP
jgi:NADPH2:quinone reductase